MIKLINVVNNTTNLRRLIDFFINFLPVKKDLAIIRIPFLTIQA